MSGPRVILNRRQGGTAASGAGLMLAFAIVAAPGAHAASASASSAPANAERFKAAVTVSTRAQSQDGRYILSADARVVPGITSADGRFSLLKTNVPDGASCAPLPDALFADSFEGAAPNPNLVVFENVNFSFPATSTGGSIQWLNGQTCACDTAPFDFNVWLSTTASELRFFWPGGATRGAVASGAVYEPLAPGAIVGPASTFTFTGSTASWVGGTSAYVGFRFVNANTTQINYGYARLTTTGPTGFPAVLESYAFDNSGAAITIPNP